MYITFYHITVCLLVTCYIAVCYIEDDKAVHEMLDCWCSEGGMKWLETLIELKFFNSSFSSLSSR